MIGGPLISCPRVPIHNKRPSVSIVSRRTRQAFHGQRFHRLPTLHAPAAHSSSSTGPCPAAESQFAHFFLQALPVQANRRGRARNISDARPTASAETQSQICVFAFAQILLLQAIILGFPPLLGSVGRPRTISSAKSATPISTISGKAPACVSSAFFQFAYIAGPSYRSSAASVSFVKAAVAAPNGAP